MPEDGSVDLYKALLRKAGALLARRAYSRGELRDRLSRYAGDAPLESVLTRLEELNLLNDEDYAYNFALCRIGQQGWGLARVRNSLLQRQVPAATVDGALERVLNELDPATVLREYVLKHSAKRRLPRDLKSIRRLILHLRRRGFDHNSISNVLKELLPAAAWQRFETGE